MCTAPRLLDTLCMKLPSLVSLTVTVSPLELALLPPSLASLPRLEALHLALEVDSVHATRGQEEAALATIGGMKRLRSLVLEGFRGGPGVMAGLRRVHSVRALSLR